MQLTIKTQLFGLGIVSVLLVTAVSITGYWGITSVSTATGEVAGAGVAIRIHIEASTFNDMTREDIDQICTKKGSDQQDAVSNLEAHSQLLAERIKAEREAVTDPAMRASLDGEVKLVQEYISAAAELSRVVVHDPPKAMDVVGHGIQLYSGLQESLQGIGDQLEKSAKDAQLRSKSKSARAGHIMFVICGVSLALLFVVVARITLGITRGLDSFSAQFKKMTEANDLTSRVAQDRSDEIGELGRCLNLFVGKMHNILTQIAHAAHEVASASGQMSTTSQQISANSEETSAQAKFVADATQHISQNLRTVATGTEEMGTSIQETAKNATEAAKFATSAVKVTETTTTTMSQLGKSSNEIGQVIKVITSIARQTNLLALNATIEAARAGEAGKGFAVVANEVKELAKETARATEDISRKVEAIQTDTEAAVNAIVSITEVINHVNGISNTIATAVEEQSATTNEISRNVSEAANGSGEITTNITGVAQSAESTSRGAAETQKAAHQLVETAAELRRLVGQFKINSNDSGQLDIASHSPHSRAAHSGL